MRKFNPASVTDSARSVVQKALEQAKKLKHSEFTTLHILAVMVHDDKSKFILKSAGGSLVRISKTLKEKLSRFPRIKGADPAPSDDIGEMLEIAANKTTNNIAVGHLVLAMKEIDATRDILTNVEAEKVVLSRDYGEELSNYSRDLTRLAKLGRLDPVIGRDTEVRRAIQTLSRRGKNNPVIIGESGVGKTSIVFAIAQRIADNDVPESLRGLSILQLDLSSLVAGAQYRGQFEERLKGVITAASEAKDVILFIDDLHNLMGSGSSESGQDAASLLKPALANGDVRCIGATTTDAYKKNIEKDPQLERRFQSIRIDEPGIEDTIAILRGLREKFQAHHGLRIQDSSLVAAARLSARYIQNRFLPDKAIDLIDEACAELKMDIESVPSVIDERERKIKRLKMERTSLEESKKDKDRKTKINQQIKELESEVSKMRKRWDSERTLIDNMKSIAESLENKKIAAKNAEQDGDLELAAKIHYSEIPDLEKRQKKSLADLKKVQADGSFLRDKVLEKDVAKVVSSWTGIPAEKMLQQDTQEALMKMEDRLHERVVGQHPAIVAVSDAIRQSRAGLTDPKAPVGTFLFLGPTGVGKCLAPETEILCYDGNIIEAQNIKEGMLLMGPNSEPRKVLSTTTGHGSMYKIIPAKGSPWICNDVHVLTLKKTGTGEIKDVPLNEYLRWSKTQKHLWKQFSVGVKFKHQDKLSVDPYFLGLWLGDGSKSVKTLITSKEIVLRDLRITNTDQEVIDSIKNVATRWECNVYEDKPKDRCSTWILTTKRGQPNRLLNEIRKCAPEGKISNKIRTASKQERFEFLAGCLDSDGCLVRNCFEIIQKRKEFADTIVFVARSLGFKVTTSDKIVNGTRYIRMIISGETNLIPTRIPRKQATKRKQIKNACNTGFKVEQIEDGKYCGFTLDGDGRFLLSDFTVTHNTELSKALAEYLFDDESAIVRLDMSEYMEKHSVSRLVGSPPGYVGHDEGGQLTEAVRHRPYSLVLLDEVEKAHPDVWNVMLQVFDEGRLTDSQGRTVDFTNTILLMTSNVGSELYYQDHDEETLDLLREKILQSKFRPEFLNRIDGVIYFHRLYQEHMIDILDIQMKSVQKRLRERELALELSDPAREWLAENGYDPTMGARPLKRLIKKEILKPLSEHLLTTQLKSGTVVKMDLDGDHLKVV